jgi:site-specific DNA-methyltransferase (cytosine-N4-specific)
MVAFALQADGWYLRSEIIWAKPNPMPESVTDRPTKAHEQVFLLAKSQRYYYDAAAIAEPLAEASAERYGYAFGGAKTEALIEANRDGVGQRTRVLGERETPTGRNRRTVWTVPTQPFSGAHFAVMPEALVEPCILAGSAPGDMVLDPFTGSGTVGVVALRHGRRFIGCELTRTYAVMARNRISGPLFAEKENA